MIKKAPKLQEETLRMNKLSATSAPPFATKVRPSTTTPPTSNLPQSQASLGGHVNSSYISKTNMMMAIMNCPKALWNSLHRRDLIQRTAIQGYLADIGNKVGLLARKEVPGLLISAIDPITREVQTREALQKESCIHEGTFFRDKASFGIRADIFLVDTATLIECKATSAASPRSEDIQDAAFQYFVMQETVNVKKVKLMYLSGDPKSMFSLHDITVQTRLEAERQQPFYEAMKEVVKLNTAPAGIPNPGCRDCPFITSCWKEEGRTINGTVFSISGIGLGKAGFRLAAEGIQNLDHPDLPGRLTALQKRFLEKVKRAQLTPDIIVESGLAEAISKIEYPVTAIDFETFTDHLESASWKAKVVQYAVWIQNSPGSDPKLEEYIHTSDDDSDQVIRQRLKAILPRSGTILHYGNLEAKVLIKTLKLKKLKDRLFDLRTPIKKFVYQRDMVGKFDLKTVSEAILKSNPYASVGISNGANAMAEYSRLNDLDASDRTELVQKLLRYCRQDSLNLLLILDELRELLIDK